MAGKSDDVTDDVQDDMPGGDEFEQLASEAEALEPTEILTGDDEPADDGPQIDTADLLQNVIGPGFAILAPGWGISAGEVRELSKAWGMVLDKWFPGGLALGPEVSAVLVTLAVIGPRIGRSRKPKAEKKEGDHATATPPPKKPPGDEKKSREPAPAGGMAYDIEANRR